MFFYSSFNFNLRNIAAIVFFTIFAVISFPCNAQVNEDNSVTISTQQNKNDSPVIPVQQDENDLSENSEEQEQDEDDSPVDPTQKDEDDSSETQEQQKKDNLPATSTQKKGNYSSKNSKNQNEDDLPITIEADNVTGRIDREIEMEGDANITRGQTHIRSDKAIYFQIDNTSEGEGNVYMRRFREQYWGNKFRYNMDTNEGWITDPRYLFLPSRAQGDGTRAELLDNDRTVIKDGTYTTCDIDDPDWYLKANALNLDLADEVADAESPDITFKGLTLPLPGGISFPLSRGRRSGFLPPTLGHSSDTGFEILVPYYFNIAPNRDLTLYPRIITKRGFQIGAEARYLEPDFRGEIRGEFMPNDRIRKENRYAISSQHKHYIGGRKSGLTFEWNYNYVSDDYYFDDFDTQFEGMANSLTGLTNANANPGSERLLKREAQLAYSGSTWNARLRVTNHLLIQDHRRGRAMVRPYHRSPQLTISKWNDKDEGFDWRVDAEWTNFWLSEADLQEHRALNNATAIGEFGDRGDRFILRPQISYMWRKPWGFIKPKASLHMAYYNIDNPFDSSRRGSMHKTIPTFSIDAGLFFDRQVSYFKKSFVQTLEPRIFYVYTPYRDQSELPNFDSAEPGLTFAQLFSENRFAGYDRISDANQLTLALTSRFINTGGAEQARFTIGQRFYFQDRRVLLDDLNNDSRSDLLMEGNVNLSKNWRVFGMMQYSTDKKKVVESEAGFQYKSGYQKIFNLSHRYLRSSSEARGLSQLVASGQWPITSKLSAVAYVSYSLPDSRFIQQLLGLEYNAGCWVLRLAGQRLFNGTANNGVSFFIQLQLNGLGRFGSNAMETFRYTIPGYTPSRNNDPYDRLFSY